MKERFSRRALFAGFATADVLYATKPFTENHHLSGFDISRITNEAQALKNKISFSNFSSISLSGRQGKIIPNADVFAKCLLTLGYFDGGKEAENQVQKLLTDKELIVAQRQKDSHSSASVKTGRSLKGPIILSINPSSILSYLEGPQNWDPNNSPLDIFWHEFYHIVQQARGPYLNRTLYPLFTAVPTALVGMDVADGVYCKIKSKNSQELSRRAIIVGAASGLIAGGLTYETMGIANPYELQAIVQAEHKLTHNPLMQTLGEKLLTFEPN